MAKNRLQTGTTKTQRTVIWAILILTIVSTGSMYVGMLLSQKNSQKEAKEQQEKLAKYQKAMTEYQEKVKAQATELSSKYYDSFKDYEKYPTSFNGGSVKELAKNDLKNGDGAEITDESEYSAYYIGWKPDGTVFDGSFEGGALKTPLTISGGARMIEGWTEGVKGMKIGGIREITIPSDKAYGDAGSPNERDSAKSIPPSTPLKFVVFAIPKIDEVPQPNYVDFGLGA